MTKQMIVSHVGDSSGMAGIVLVKDVMTKHVKTAPPDSTVKEVVAAMNKFDIGSIVIVQDDRPLGIITERDILRRVIELGLSPEALTARQIMTSPVLTISETASIEEAAELMTKKKVKKLLVLNKQKFVGVVTIIDIVTRVPAMLSVLRELFRPYQGPF